MRQVFRLLIFLCLVVLPAQADDAAERILSWCRKNYPNFTFQNTRQSGNWSVVEGQLTEHQLPARFLFRRHDRGGWFEIAFVRRGYDLSAEDLFSAGVLTRDIASLLPQNPGIARLRNLPPDSLVLDRFNLAGEKDYPDGMRRDPWSMMLLRNEIYARHGRPFQDPELRAIFLERGWYRPDAAYSDTRLTRRQADNVRALLRWQKRTEANLERIP